MRTFVQAQWIAGRLRSLEVFVKRIRQPIPFPNLENSIEELNGIRAADELHRPNNFTALRHLCV